MVAKNLWKSFLCLFSESAMWIFNYKITITCLKQKLVTNWLSTSICFGLFFFVLMSFPEIVHQRPAGTEVGACPCSCSRQVLESQRQTRPERKEISTFIKTILCQRPPNVQIERMKGLESQEQGQYYHQNASFNLINSTSLYVFFSKCDKWLCFAYKPCMCITVALITFNSKTLYLHRSL